MICCYQSAILFLNCIKKYAIFIDIQTSFFKNKFYRCLRIIPLKENKHNKLALVKQI